MVALLTIVVVMVLALAVLVIGLLRSHADILHALNKLGAGESLGVEPHDHGGDGAGAGSREAGHAPGDRSGPLTIGPALPPERDTASVPDVVGVTPTGDAIAVAVGTAEHHTLIAFLSSGCSTCQGFWEALGRPGGPGLPAGVRPVVVTRGIEFERPAELAAREVLERGIPVVMSNEAFDAYEVPGSPFFVLVDGPRARRIGEGSAMVMDQIVRMVAQALAESAHESAFTLPDPEAADRAREAENDRLLLSAGIHPGHPSLYADPFAPGRRSDAGDPPAGPPQR